MEWAERLSAIERSGMSVAEIARTIGAKPNTLRACLERMSDESGLLPSLDRFLQEKSLGTYDPQARAAAIIRDCDGLLKRHLTPEMLVVVLDGAIASLARISEELKSIVPDSHRG